MYNVSGEHIWLVLDGPVDTLWIENLNSVLDDNKTLTLANGDRIPMGPNCKIIFEPHNIDNASPATVSRNGMVYMSSSGLDWQPLAQAWLKTRTAFESNLFMGLFENSFLPVYQMAQQSLTFKMDVLEAFIVRQCCDLLQGLLPGSEEKGSAGPSQAIPTTGNMSNKHYERLYIFALMWSFGAFLELDDRVKMEAFLREHETIRLDLPDTKSSGSECTMFEFFVDPETGQWNHWDRKVVPYDYPPDHTPQYASILVPNVDNVRTEFLMDVIAKQVTLL